MHYYKRNLGDYAKKAGRLSMLQHGAYTLLIDSCYDREQFPTRAEAIDWTWASSTAEIEAVDFVLSKFFVLEEGVYVQARIREELNEYHEKAATNKRIAEERETKRRDSRTNRERGVDEKPSGGHEAPPNHEPITTNHKPVIPACAGIERAPATEACLAMKAAGMQSVSPSSPKLIALLEAGITVDELAAAAKVAVGRGKGFSYALAAAEGQRRDAATAALPAVVLQIHGRRTPAPDNFASRAYVGGKL